MASLASRPPAASVIAQVLRAQSTAPRRSRVDRLFGRSPLAPDADSWFRGALGELAVAQRLAGLGPEWRVIHAVPVGTRGADIDHLVIGPTGVFTVNTKHHAGRSVWVGERRVMVDGQRTDHLRNAAHEAARASRRLSAATGVAVDVAPLVVIVGASRLTANARSAQVVVLSSGSVAGWLRSRPWFLPPESVDSIAAAASDLATWNAAPAPEPDLAAFADLREQIGRARFRRRVWTGGLLVGLVGVTMTAPLWVGTVLAGTVIR